MGGLGHAPWGALTWPQFEAVRREVKVAVLPIGAIEQHGPHLPLETDNILAAAFSARLADRLGCLLLPVLPFGQVWSLRHFPGSLTVSSPTMTRFVRELVESMGCQGIMLVAAVSGHLGNLAALKEAARQLSLQTGPRLVYLNYPGLAAACEGLLDAPRSHPGIVHADEIETSLLLAIAPDRVDMSQAVSEYPRYPADFDHTADGWERVSRSGVFGDATKATGPKGEAMFERLLQQAEAIVRAAMAGAAPDGARADDPGPT